MWRKNKTFLNSDCITCTFIYSKVGEKQPITRCASEINRRKSLNMNRLYFEQHLLRLLQQRTETKWWKSNNSWQKALRCSMNNVDLQIPAELKVTPAWDSLRHRFSKTLSCQLCGKWAHLQKNPEDGSTEGQSVAHKHPLSRQMKHKH